MDRLLDAAVFTFLAAVAFYAGMLTQRVASLEEWRGEMRHNMDAIFTQLRHLETLIRNGDT